MIPAHWVLEMHPDGGGHFLAERGAAPASGRLEAGTIDRAIRLSPEFVRHVFQTAEAKKAFNLRCESSLKVAFQGWKTLSYRGPAGQGACTFNYSGDREIAQLADEMLAVATTLEAGARLELLLAHDRLGLDRETETLFQQARDGQARQLSAIHAILERLASDASVLERVQKRARQLLAME